MTYYTLNEERPVTALLGRDTTMVIPPIGTRVKVEGNTAYVLGKDGETWYELIDFVHDLMVSLDKDE